MDGETRRNLITLGVIAALALGAWGARGALGIEWSAESVRETVAQFGVWGPVVFVLLVGLRTILLIPSQILLVAAGLCFGAGAGTLYGALGIVLSASLAFGGARWLGREAVLSRVPPNLRAAFELAGRRGGAAVLFLGTSYPVGPITAYHAGAGLTTMAVPAFLIAVAGGGLIRAATYTLFGSTLVGGESWKILVASALLLGLTALPLLHPRGRRWLRTRFRWPQDEKRD